MKTKNPFIEGIILFGIISLALAAWIFATRTGVLPMLQKALPPLGGRKLIFQLAIVLGLILPTLWLLMDWSKKPVRIALLAFVLMQGLQIATEYALSRYGFANLIIPAAIIYVGYRLIQLIRLQILVMQTSYANVFSKLLRSIIVIANLALWSIVLIRHIGWRLPALLM